MSYLGSRSRDVFPPTFFPEMIFKFAALVLNYTSRHLAASEIFVADISLSR